MPVFDIMGNWPVWSVEMWPVRSGRVVMAVYAKWVARPSVIGGEGRKSSVFSGECRCVIRRDKDGLGAVKIFAFLIEMAECGCHGFG